MLSMFVLHWSRPRIEWWSGTSRNVDVFLVSYEMNITHTFEICINTSWWRAVIQLPPNGDMLNGRLLRLFLDQHCSIIQLWVMINWSIQSFRLHLAIIRRSVAWFMNWIMWKIPVIYWAVSLFNTNRLSWRTNIFCCEPYNIHFARIGLLCVERSYWSVELFPFVAVLYGWKISKRTLNPFPTIDYVLTFDCSDKKPDDEDSPDELRLRVKNRRHKNKEKKSDSESPERKRSKSSNASKSKKERESRMKSAVVVRKRKNDGSDSDSDNSSSWAQEGECRQF